MRSRLAAHAIVAADMSHGSVDHDAYRGHVDDPCNGFVSSEIGLDAGLVISVRR